MGDVTDATFERDVVERSHQVPVIVDVWADWCAPCRALGPILERAVDATAGAVELAKVDADTNPGIVTAFAVQSIPSVFAFKDGKVVDSFIGVPPESSVTKFVERLVPSEADRLAERGDEESLRAALELDPGHAGAVVALARLLIDRGESDEALGLLARVPETGEVRRLVARARTVDAAGSSTDDVDARLGALLERVRDDHAARRQFLDLLEVLGPDDPRTAQYRRAFSSRLF